jgi:hypothetical protein
MMRQTPNRTPTIPTTSPVRPENLQQASREVSFDRSSPIIPFHSIAPSDSPRQSVVHGSSSVVGSQSIKRRPPKAASLATPIFDPISPNSIGQRLKHPPVIPASPKAPFEFPRRIDSDPPCGMVRSNAGCPLPGKPSAAKTRREHPRAPLKPERHPSPADHSSSSLRLP